MGQWQEKVWSGGGEKGVPILGFPLKLFWEKYPVRMTSHPKEVNMSYNCQVHAIEVGKGETQPSYGWEYEGK